ncbi:MAG TPA: hypothetical protein VMY18_12930 [Acidobacteriota bacterium]|nr:hypothetical protein [Acidobacteriota bacterium]
MPEPWTILSRSDSFESEEELREVFGPDAVISRVGPFNLIHLDSPTPEEVTRRVAEFDPEDLFEDDCPLCQMLREQGGNVVYDESF